MGELLRQCVLLGAGARALAVDRVEVAAAARAEGVGHRRGGIIEERREVRVGQGIHGRAPFSAGPSGETQ
ncbi:hypothetical protein [Bowdeniella nasicola]|uniref:hypothetical protein n=1 Tax=Bowdeniella nasicola TaxID=208480 RepID=UPI0011613BE2|nr:hypothetical protein [Bowdeniella nasicola]